MVLLTMVYFIVFSPDRNYYKSYYLLLSSMKVLAKALKDGYREKTLLATKLPIWNVKNRADLVRLLDEQLNNIAHKTLRFVNG